MNLNRILRLAFVLSSALWLMLACSSASLGQNGEPSVPSNDSLQRRLEQLAQTNTHFSLEVITRKRPLSLWTSREQRMTDQHPLAETQMRLARELQILSAEREGLVALLKHPDPKVRTLAMGAIFEREDGRDLPLLAPLLDDSAATFPDLHESENSRPGPYPMTELESPQSVGMVAEALLRFWGVQPQGSWETRPGGGSRILTTNDFLVYWDPRKDRDYCAGWFTVKLARACRGTSPTQPEYVADVLRVRRQIDQLPSDDRTWILLWLFGDYESDKLTTESELLELAKQLGPERLLLLLQRKIPTTDPDLQPRNPKHWSGTHMTFFVLKHAGQLLRPEDADKLLAYGAAEAEQNRKGGLSNPTSPQWWPIAAAHLQPTRAASILHTAFDTIQGRNEYHAQMRADLAVALWDVCGASEEKFLVDWFYEEFPTKQLWVNWRRSFIENVAATDQPSPQKLVYSLVQDARFERLDWDVASLQSLANVIRGWLGKPPIPQADLDAIRWEEQPVLRKQLLVELRTSALQLKK